MVQKTATKASTSSKKKLPAAPLAGAANRGKKVMKHPLFEKTPRSYRLGGAIQHKRDLTRFVRWPKYVVLQRQKRILVQRLKVPPAINQFNYAIEKNAAGQLLRLLSKYKPETRVEKRQRLVEEAERRAKGEGAQNKKKPQLLKFGLNHVTDLVEIKKAKLVVIAHDVDPVELVCWLPALCRKKEVAYCVIKGKARLGQLVHKKTASCVAIENVRKEDQSEFDMMCKNFRAQFNDNVELRRKWGGGIMGIKSQHVQQKKEKVLALEQAKKLGLQV